MRKFLLLGILIGVAIVFAPSVAAHAARPPLKVFYAGPEGGISRALALDTGIDIITQPAQADAFVLNGAAPDLEIIQQRVAQGAGLVLVLGPYLTANQVGRLLDEPVRLSFHDDPLSLNPANAGSDPVLSQIVWTSAPQIRQRATLEAPGLASLVSGYEDGEVILGIKTGPQGNPIFVLTPFINQDNPQVQDWAYFNYLIHHLTRRSAGQDPDSFATYPASPVPHAAEQRLLYLALAGVLLAAGVAFWRVRKYSRSHPEALDVVVANQVLFAKREAGTGWETVGFHRPLGGFFLALFLGMILFIPMAIYQNLILPVYILPSAQALGIWGRVTQFFGLIWTFFDMGTSIAFVKFLSQHRVHDPRKGIQYGQLFVWWQLLSGAVQVAIMVVLSGSILPHTAYAIYAWSIVIHTFVQIPGFYQVIRNGLTGLQRFDYAQVLDLVLAALFPMLAQPVFVSLMVLWGRAHPAFGAAMGGLFGMGLAAYAAEALTFLLGVWLFRRLGFNARVYFLAHFDWQVIKDSFRFGIFEMLGSAVVGLGQSMEILITQGHLVNYAETWGNWVIAQNFVFGFQVLSTLYSNLMPSISEAISHGRKMLSQYYSAVAYQWGGVISGMLAAILLAVADRFIIGASGPEFVRAAAYAMPLLLWGAMQFPSWVGDNVQRGVNKPYWMLVLCSLEQIIRIALAFLLITSLQIAGLIVAYFVALITKDLVGFFVNNRVCFRQRFYIWQSAVAPLLAGAAHYFILRGLGTLLWRGDQVSSVLIFFIAILPSYPLFAFFYGLVGGWEDGTLEEVRRGAELSGIMRPFARVFWAATAFGARLSPLHGRFRIDIRPAALVEAESLTAERVSLAHIEPPAAETGALPVPEWAPVE